MCAASLRFLMLPLSLALFREGGGGVLFRCIERILPGCAIKLVVYSGS
jgi:hypothetical protein